MHSERIYGFHFEQRLYHMLFSSCLRSYDLTTLGRNWSGYLSCQKKVRYPILIFVYTLFCLFHTRRSSHGHYPASCLLCLLNVMKLSIFGLWCFWKGKRRRLMASNLNIVSLGLIWGIDMFTEPRVYACDDQSVGSLGVYMSSEPLPAHI